MIRVVCVNPEGVGVETERLFEVLQEDVMKYEEKGFVVIGDFNAGTGLEDRPNSNGKGCWI